MDQQLDQDKYPATVNPTNAKNDRTSPEEVGHADIVEIICQTSGVQYYWPTELERKEMMSYTIWQLQVVFQVFQGEMAKCSSCRTSQRFQFALAMGRYSQPS